jgi:hypothetical protein
VAAEETARIAAEEEAARLSALRAERTALTEPDLSYAGDITMTGSKTAHSGGASAKKRPGKRPLTAKEKKERAATIERVVMQLPLAFRGSDVVGWPAPMRACRIDPAAVSSKPDGDGHRETAHRYFKGIQAYVLATAT